MKWPRDILAERFGDDEPEFITQLCRCENCRELHECAPAFGYNWLCEPCAFDQRFEAEIQKTFGQAFTWQDGHVLKHGQPADLTDHEKRLLVQCEMAANKPKT